MTACSSAPSRASRSGDETAVRTVIPLKGAPRGDPLVASVDEAVSRCIESHSEEVVATALARYASEGPPGQSPVRHEDVEVLLEDHGAFGCTSQPFEGNLTHYRFTLRRPKARVVLDPPRIEALVFVVETSWAPTDTARFVDIFKAELRGCLERDIRAIALERGLVDAR
jgi:hypothetical protein